MSGVFARDAREAAAQALERLAERLDVERIAGQSSTRPTDSQRTRIKAAVPSLPPMRPRLCPGRRQSLERLIRVPARTARGLRAAHGDVSLLAVSFGYSASTDCSHAAWRHTLPGRAHDPRRASRSSLRHAPSTGWSARAPRHRQGGTPQHPTPSHDPSRAWTRPRTRAPRSPPRNTTATRRRGGTHRGSHKPLQTARGDQRKLRAQLAARAWAERLEGVVLQGLASGDGTGSMARPRRWRAHAVVSRDGNRLPRHRAAQVRHHDQYADEARRRASLHEPSASTSTTKRPGSSPLVNHPKPYGRRK